MFSKKVEDLTVGEQLIAATVIAAGSAAAYFGGIVMLGYGLEKVASYREKRQLKAK